MQFHGIQSILQASSGDSRQTRVSTSRWVQDTTQVGIWDSLRWVSSGPVVSYLAGYVILFAFTTPEMYCLHAMATLIKYATGMLPTPIVEDPIIPEAPVTASPASTQSNLLANPEARNSRLPDVGVPLSRLHPHDKESKEETKLAHKHAGEPSFYHNGLDTMIRERICTHRIIHPLELESELHVFRLPPELIGKISELAALRYIKGPQFTPMYKSFENTRQQNIERAHQNTVWNMAQLQKDFSGAIPHTRTA
ncbi:hypothetical protein L226DRAFT_520890 [Lentinus tigrinus ALCF2SS1-7]|uniref:uncharacterized protein n=1 Tax=Lentinus tigrinus ALCF2SS1-7 TaxID=1328758 RepID=UPI0011662780|nr:hypothetical protein L226DRAFT_520890 [Lentinus tigrinus ALCF2SS1-7]